MNVKEAKAVLKYAKSVTVYVAVTHDDGINASISKAQALLILDQFQADVTVNASYEIATKTLNIG